MRFLLRLLLNGVAIVIAAWCIPGVTLSGPVPALIAGVMLGFINALVRPVLLLLTLPFTVITLGTEWLVRNEFAGARLSDEELAVATCLARMAEYVDGGPGFCDLAEGVHDHYLGLMIDAAVASGTTVRVGGHLWDEGRS